MPGYLHTSRRHARSNHALPAGWSQITEAAAGAWVSGIYLGLLPSALGFVLWAYAVGRLPVARSTSLLYLVPPVATLIAWAWLDELPLPAEIAGGAVVVAGVAIISRGPTIVQTWRRRTGRRREARRDLARLG